MLLLAAATTPPPTTSRRSGTQRSPRVVVRTEHGSQLSPADAISEVFDAVAVPVPR
jgi:hypothetical protein